MTFVFRSASALALLGAVFAAAPSPAAHAATPDCSVEGGTLLSWPSVDPVWELCWIPPNSSVGPRGSGLELRAIHYRGIPAARRIHAPMLFAEYNGGSGGDCYRDWKDDPTPILAHTSTHNQMAVPPDLGRLATTACSVSQHPTNSFGTCPFQQPTGSGYSCTASSGVVIEDLGDQVSLTSQYRADWYMYDSRISFGANGVIVPTFGFGNNNGTYNNVTHWHHNYWRFDFGIDGQNSHVVSANGIDQTVEFHDLRGAPGSKTWAVRNPATGRGFQLVPGANDYVVGTNESNRGFHTVDFMATRYIASEYGDNPSYDLFDCGMDQDALVNGASIDQQDVVLWYRVAVRDTTSNSWPPGCGGVGNPCIAQDSMVCKNAGPQLVPFGDWGQGLPEEADLAVVAASDPLQASPGDVVQIAVDVNNIGPQDVNEATVTLDLPANLGLAIDQPVSANWSCAETSAVLVTCTFGNGSIAATGQSSFGVNLEVDLAATAADYDTVVTLSSSEWLDPSSANNVSTATTTVVVLAKEADLSISASDDPDPVSAGAPLLLQFTIANAGPRAVSQAEVSISLPLELTLAVGLLGSSDWSCQEVSQGTLACDFVGASIEAAGQSSFSLPLSVSAKALSGSVQTTMSVQSADWADPQPGNNVFAVDTTISAAPPILIFADDFEP